MWTSTRISEILQKLCICYWYWCFDSSLNVWFCNECVSVMPFRFVNVIKWLRALMWLCVDDFMPTSFVKDIMYSWLNKGVFVCKSDSVWQAVCQPCLKLTCGHLSISCGRPIRDNALNLEEFVGLVAPNYSEPKAHVALLEWCGQETAFQLSGVPREQRLLCKGHINMQITQT